ncbi:leucine-rich repeat domain-containing protein [Chloroflexota bacterium]
MSDVFISHVEEDAEIALEIALGLEEAGYTTWCYEVDSIPGPSYLLQTGQAVEEAKALVLIISPHSLGSRQVTNEVIRAHETGKWFIPVLQDITHIEFQNRQPEWREALGAASSIRIPAEGVADIIPRIVSGLKASGILPGAKPEVSHVVQVRKILSKLKGPMVLEKTKEPPITATKPKLEVAATEIRPLTTKEAGRRQSWIWLALIASAIVVLSVAGVIFLATRTPPPPPTPAPSPPAPTPTPATQVTFTDDNLRLAISEAIHKTTGLIYASELQSLTTLSAQGRNISNLTGLEHCVNLQVLNIYENNFSDVTPLTGLTSLRELYIYKNSISNISPLAGLVGLEELWLGRNNISDISPLRGLTNLNVLVLIYNNITDILPLVENKGLSNGDTVNLTGNTLSTTSINVHIPQLEERGVTVLFK